MSSLLQSLGIDRLSRAEQIQLVGEIWDHIAATPEQIPFTEAQQQEIDRRLAAYQANPENVIPWEQVKATAEQRLRQ